MFKTKRLYIRRIKESDWVEIKEIWSSIKKTEYVKYDRYMELDDALVKSRISKYASFENSIDHMFFAVILFDKIIGVVSFNKREVGYEIGYFFHPYTYGNGYAKESISYLIKMLKKEGVKKISAGTALENTPSVKLLTSLNFKMVGTEKVSFYKDEEGNDIILDGGIFELNL